MLARPLLTGFAIGAVLAAGVVAGPAHAGAWSKPAGGGYAKLGSATFVSDTVYDVDGNMRKSDPWLLRAQTIYAYGELGLTDRLTLVGFVPWIFSTNQHASGLNLHTGGFGDAMGGLQVGLWQGGTIAVALRGEVKIPLYRGGPAIEGRQSTPVEGYPRSSSYFPALGDGQVDLTGWLSVGGGLPFLGGFFNVEGGFRYRSGGVTHATVGNANAGVFLWRRRVLLMANMQRVASLPAIPGDPKIRSKAFSAVGPSMAVYAWRGLAVELGGDYIFRGTNAAGGVQLLSGVSYAW